jgi:CO/xanthine dehydrogenase Mo-binding subunit
MQSEQPTEVSSFVNQSKPGTRWPAEGTVSSHSPLAKACGEATFPSDFSLPGMLIGKVFYSPYPHCRVNSLDTDRAKRLPGVRAVLTWNDIPGINKDIKTIADQPFLAEDRARTVMDALALVAAETEEIAEAAIQAIQADLTPLPAMFDINEALAPGALKIHPNGNLAYEFKIIHGEVDAGMMEAEIIIENEYRFPCIDHAYMETEASVAAIDDEGVITVWQGSHDIFSDRIGLSVGFGWPEERFRVVLIPAGGSFGGKHVPVDFFAALLSNATDRPVKIHYSRRQSLRGHAKRSSMLVHHRLGARNDGHITAMDVRVVSDTGAYVHYAPLILDFCCIHATGPYRAPHARVTGKLVYTNNIVGSGMRGLGTPQVEFAVESQMDQLARRLNMHPLKLRWINALKEGDEIITGRAVPGCRYADTLSAASQRVMVELDGNRI